MYWFDDLSGAAKSPLEWDRDWTTLLIVLVTTLVLGLLRCTSYDLLVQKGESPVERKNHDRWTNGRLLAGSTCETVWAMLVSVTVGTSMSPKDHHVRPSRSK